MTLAYANEPSQVAGPIGSLAGESTCVDMLRVRHKSAQLDKIQKGLAFCQTNTKRILHTLDLQSFSRAELQALSQRTTPEKRKTTLQLLNRFKQLAQVHKELLAKQANYQAHNSPNWRDAARLCDEQGHSHLFPKSFRTQT